MSIFRPLISLKADDVRGADRYDFSWPWICRSGSLPIGVKGGLLWPRRQRRAASLRLRKSFTR
jgi:hypothetical protein